MIDVPRYEHDCSTCVFLGREDARDVYVCPQSGMPTVILRYGSDGPAYESGSHLLRVLPMPMREVASEHLDRWRVA